MRPGGPAVWGKAFQAAINAHDAPGYGKLIGAFHCEFGLQNRGIEVMMSLCVSDHGTVSG